MPFDPNHGLPEEQMLTSLFAIATLLKNHSQVPFLHFFELLPLRLSGWTLSFGLEELPLITDFMLPRLIKQLFHIPVSAALRMPV